MIQDTRGTAPLAESIVRRRLDGPDIRLPSPRFDTASEHAVTRYLDVAARRLSSRSTKSEVIGWTIREINGVLREFRNSCSKEQWTSFIPVCRQHPVVEVLFEDKFIERAFKKPRGYAGDAVLLDYIYGNEQFWSPPEMSWIGQRIHRWSTTSIACEAVKARRATCAQMVDRLAQEMKLPHVLSFAAGHLREAEISSAILRRRLGRLVGVDTDVRSLETIDAEYGRYGAETLLASARELISGRLDIGTFDFIYTSGLYDYLADSMCSRLTSELFYKLNPGGRLLLTNFSEDIEGVGFMEAIMDWNLIYRDRMQLMGLTARIPEREIARITSFAEENCNVVFLLVERASD